MTQAFAFRGAIAFSALFAIAACDAIPQDDGPRIIADGYDRGILGGGFVDAKHLSQLEAGIFVDPDGCHVWMIDDGAQGYWSRRRDPRSGLPVCTDIAPPGSVVGDIRSGSSFQFDLAR